MKKKLTGLALPQRMLDLRDLRAPADKLRLYYGIDPGASGAFAAVDERGRLVHSFGFKSMTELDVLQGIYEWMRIEKFTPESCALERVGSMPGQGVSSTFKFGVSYGFVRCAVISTGVAWSNPTPATWQRKMKCLSGGDKGVPLAKAQQLFPGVRMAKTGKNAVYDAILLAEYERRVSLGLEFN